MPRTRVEDLDIAWDVAGPADAAPVLLINGLSAVRQSWALQVAALAESYRVYTYDNRDVGETGPGGDPRPYGVDRFARDAIGLIEALCLGPVHVIGASMGGCIALELALLRPDLTRSAQIVCSWARTDPWLAELFAQWVAIQTGMGPLMLDRVTSIWAFTERWYEDPERLAALAREAEAYPYPQTAAMFARQSNAVIGFDTVDRLSGLSCPVHVVAGEEDILTPLRFSRQIADAAPGAVLTVLPEVGHGMFLETPEAFNAALIGFLAGQDS
jgi:pimeloyl-ACP methyl ester carboxylesterase